ncbi:MAG: hypothetical protein KF766_07665 [Rhodocyclaceae bacterium]|nr:hypothetical protein [Rhodocyclaceae bacterium]
MQHVGEAVRTGALTEAQAFRNTADWFFLQYETAKTAALTAAQNASAAGNTSAAEFWQQRAQSLTNTMAERATMTDAAWLNGRAALDVRDSLRNLGGALAHTAAAAGFAYEAAQMFDAAIRGDWDRVGEVSTGMIGATAFGYVGMMVAAAIIAPATAVGVIGVGIVGGAFAALGHALGVKAWVSNTFESAQRFLHGRDPLILDLDGDGLETVGVAAGVLFDHDGDGVASGTGWVSSDDGFLVLDRNGNGQIDNGRELFGDATPLAGGGTAADGFAALAQEDTNADGRVDSLDANWSNLRVWRPQPGTGFRRAANFTLGSLGIAASTWRSPSTCRRWPTAIRYGPRRLCQERRQHRYQLARPASWPT